MEDGCERARRKTEMACIMWWMRHHQGVCSYKWVCDSSGNEATMVLAAPTQLSAIRLEKLTLVVSFHGRRTVKHGRVSRICALQSWNRRSMRSRPKASVGSRDGSYSRNSDGSEETHWSSRWFRRAMSLCMSSGDRIIVPAE